MKKQIVN